MSPPAASAPWASPAAAIGAKYGAPDRTVVAIIGDGGFQMTLQELGTIMQFGANVKIIIMNNRFLGMVANGRNSSTTNAILSRHHQPDFVALAKPTTSKHKA